MNNIYFNSTRHQRYEKGVEVGDLQVCERIIEIKRNTSGQNGYILEPGKGYIVTIHAIDKDGASNVQMSPKPMVIVKETDNEIEMRGYEVAAYTPFGIVNVNQSDYGLTILSNENNGTKCILHMFDRNTRIEYLNCSELDSPNINDIPYWDSKIQELRSQYYRNGWVVEYDTFKKYVYSLATENDVKNFWGWLFDDNTLWRYNWRTIPFRYKMLFQLFLEHCRN